MWESVQEPKRKRPRTSQYDVGVAVAIGLTLLFGTALFLWVGLGPHSDNVRQDGQLGDLQTQVTAIDTIVMELMNTAGNVTVLRTGTCEMNLILDGPQTPTGVPITVPYSYKRVTLGSYGMDYVCLEPPSDPMTAPADIIAIGFLNCMPPDFNVPLASFTSGFLGTYPIPFSGNIVSINSAPPTDSQWYLLVDTGGFFSAQQGIYLVSSSYLGVRPPIGVSADVFQLIAPINYPVASAKTII